MRTRGAEKLLWLVVEVEVDAERNGCFAERQLQLGLSSSTRRYLELVIGSVHIKNE